MNVTLILEIIILTLIAFGTFVNIRIFSMIPKIIDSYISEKIREFTRPENIEKYREPIQKFSEEIIMKAIQDLAPKFQGSQGGSMPALPGGNPMMGMAAGFLPKRYQGLLAIASMFFGKKDQGSGGGSGKNPFE